MVSAVAHVEKDALLPRLADRNGDPLAVIQDAHPPPMEKMGHHISGFQQFKDLVQGNRRVGYVNHGRETAGQGCRLLGPPERLQAVAAHRFLLLSHLYSQDQPGIASGHLRRPLRVEQGEVSRFPYPQIGQSNGGDMQKGQKASLRPVDQEFSESLEGGCPCASLVHQGGNARGKTGGVGLEAQFVGLQESVSVKVDQARRDDQTAGLNHPPRLGRVYIRRYPGDGPAPNSHIAAIIHIRRLIQNSSAFNEQVVFHGCSSLSGECRAGKQITELPENCIKKILPFLTFKGHSYIIMAENSIHRSVSGRNKR